MCAPRRGNKFSKLQLPAYRNAVPVCQRTSADLSGTLQRTSESSQERSGLELASSSLQRPRAYASKLQRPATAMQTNPATRHACRNGRCTHTRARICNLQRPRASKCNPILPRATRAGIGNNGSVKKNRAGETNVVTRSRATRTQKPKEKPTAEPTSTPAAQCCRLLLSLGVCRVLLAFQKVPTAAPCRPLTLWGTSPRAAGSTCQLQVDPASCRHTSDTDPDVCPPDRASTALSARPPDRAPIALTAHPAEVEPLRFRTGDEPLRTDPGDRPLHGGDPQPFMGTTACSVIC